MASQHHPFVDIATPSVAATGDGVFTYAIPDHLQGGLQIGQLVRIPLRRRLEPGIVTRVHDEAPEFELRPVDSVVEPMFVLPEWALDVASWMATTTRCTLYDASAPFLPPGESHAAELRRADAIASRVGGASDRA